MTDKSPLEKSIEERLEHERHCDPSEKKTPNRFNIQMIMLVSIIIGLLLTLLRVWQMLVS